MSFKIILPERNPGSGKHMKQQHGVEKPSITDNFSVLKKCWNKLDCLVYEMLFIKELKPSLNVRSDSICAKLFTDDQYICVISRTLECRLLTTLTYNKLSILIMMFDTSKRRLTLLLIFLVKCFNKQLIIRNRGLTHKSWRVFAE